MTTNPWPELERQVLERGLTVIGVDEAGRGPLFGPVVAGAAILHSPNTIDGLACSKTLSEKKREALYPQIQSQAKHWAVAQASVEEIDEINILNASLLAMKRAVTQVAEQSGLQESQLLVLVDGNKVPKWRFQARAIVKGDVYVPAISAGSILAKVWRDQWCHEQAELYPQYELDRHMGYPTAQHMSLLKLYGASPLHRKTFRPVREVLQEQQGNL
ncbi:MAG: ribonuclease HII, partial [Limnobacter sp.]|nr:ribonuclease HII [Limnobacter sp.]